jgi:hypothetical protein
VELLYTGLSPEHQESVEEVDNTYFVGRGCVEEITAANLEGWFERSHWKNFHTLSSVGQCGTTGSGSGLLAGFLLGGTTLMGYFWISYGDFTTPIRL